MNLSYIVNNKENPIPVKTALNEEILFVDEVLTLTAGETATILTNEDYSIMDWFEFGTNSKDFQLFIRYKKGGTYFPLGAVKNDGSGTAVFRPKFIIEHNISLFEIQSYDVQNNTYKFSLKNTMYFPEGVQLAVRNMETDKDINAAIRGSFRVMK